MAHRSLSHRLLAAVAAACMISAGVAGSTGCGYRSSYVPVNDGRARVIWGPDNEATVAAMGSTISPECSSEIRRLTDQRYDVVRLADGSSLNLVAARPYVGSYQMSREVWTPRYYGAPIVIVNPGIAPPFVRPPLFLPSLVGRPIFFPTHIAAGPGFSGPAFRTGGGGGSFGGGSGGKGAEYLLAIAVIIAVSVLPAVDLGLSASTPESSARASSATDVVNALNDLARTPGSPCYQGGAS